MAVDALGVILASLKHNQSLQELSLDGSVDFLRETLWDGLQALRDNRALKRLEIKDCHFSNSCAIVMAQVLRHNSALEELSLYMNSFSDLGARALAKTLQESSSLKRLDVSYCRLTSNVVPSLARNKSICEAEFLQTLRTPGEIKALQAVLLVNRSLHRLKFSYDNLPSKAPAMLARALENNFVFLTLEFEYQHTETDMHPVVKALNRNRSLLNRAVECVLDAARDEQSTRALRLLSATDSLLDAVSVASGKSPVSRGADDDVGNNDISGGGGGAAGGGGGGGGRSFPPPEPRRKPIVPRPTRVHPSPVQPPPVTTPAQPPVGPDPVGPQPPPPPRPPTAPPPPPPTGRPRPPLPPPPQPPPPPPPPRQTSTNELVCTIGTYAVVPAMLPPDGLCDYMYFCHVVVSKNKVYADRLDFSWDVFKAEMKKRDKTGAGIGFDSR
nr:protein phosphatase 1 regulatory subunit 37-like [Rhipicephalus microplus]